MPQYSQPKLHPVDQVRGYCEYLVDFTPALRRLLDSSPESADASRRAADDLLAARHRPSKQLLAVAAEEVTRREQFILLDEQQVTYKTVMQAVERANDENIKTAVVVLGGPGSARACWR